MKRLRNKNRLNPMVLTEKGTIFFCDFDSNERVAVQSVKDVGNTGR